MRNPQEPRDAVGGHLDDEGVSECAFSPEQAAPAALGHVGGCAECAARVEELSRLLASLADLPEPAIPESVLIRLDATVEQAWQEVDAENLREARAEQRRGRPWLRKRLAVSITALGVLTGVVLGIVGVGVLAHSGSTSNSSASTASGTVVPAMRPDLSLMARQALEADSFGTTYGAVATSATATSPAAGSTATVRSEAGPAVQQMAKCFQAPDRSGYTVVAAAAEAVSGEPASLVVYRSDKEPASTTTFFAVLYAGSCPDSASAVLDEGIVSISR